MIGHVTPPDARLAASLLLLRDGASVASAAGLSNSADGGALEVLMLRRAERAADPRSGVMVFPGGVLDPRDRAAHGASTGPNDAEWSARLELPQGGLDYAVAALRETFEEVGLLIACDGAGQVWRPERATPGQLNALQALRERLQRSEASADELLRDHGLRWDTRGLAYYSHWLTPPGTIKRFDTRFFCALAPLDQTAQADEGEATALVWTTPAAALHAHSGMKLLPVTRRTLTELSRHARAADAYAEAGQRRQIRVTMPRRALGREGQQVVVLPDELPWAEIGRLDPEGRADVTSFITAGRVVRLSPLVRRVTAPNPGPMTGPGTNTYLVAGSAGWTVIDPGPDDDRHLQAIMDAAGQRIERILVTHTHKDHSPLAGALSRASGAPVFGRTAAHPMWQDEGFKPDGDLLDGQRLQLQDGCTLRVVHTPGHASNHLCYLLEEEQLLFTGDHVMAGSTVVINPPDGDMAAYLGSLNELLRMPLQWLAPGHGFLVAEPHEVLRALIAHRLRREAKVMAALGTASQTTTDALLPLVYDDVPSALHAMARRSLLAHLLKLQHDGVLSQSAEHQWVRTSVARG